VVYSKGSREERQGWRDDSKANCNEERCKDKNSNFTRKFRKRVREFILHSKYPSLSGIAPELSFNYIDKIVQQLDNSLQIGKFTA
jgi:hypothetical protein